MADFVLKDDALSRVSDAPEPIRRTVDRAEKPNPLLPALEASWAARTRRNGSDVETGSTKQYRSYSAAETLAVVRALRRGSDKLNVGVRIVAPQTRTPKVDENGEPVMGKDGKQRENIEYRPGTIIFETHTRQKRERKTDQDGAEDSTDQEQEGSEDENEDEDSTDDQEQEGSEDEDSTDQEQPTESAWQ